MKTSPTGETKTLRGCKAHHQGFTLIITISLLVLLTLVALGLLSLSSISLRDSARGSANSVARANARMAMMLAIGELQKQLGPDQRVSITADQRPDLGTDGAQTSAAIGNRKWTGVFNSWTAAQLTRPNPLFRSWLVSGNPNQLNTVARAETPLAPAESIQLVGAGTLGAVVDDRVTVPSMNLTSGSARQGRFGWWVGDQGVKASLATQLPSQETSLGVRRNQLQSAPRNAAELAGVGTVKPFAALAVDDVRLARVTSWQQAGLVAADIVTPRSLFHDLAASSSGLLTNVRAGGFRRDLSLKMESYTSTPDLADTSNVLYNVQGEEGINFQELWSYYQSYKQLQYGSGGSYTTGGSIPSSAPYFRTADTLDAVKTDDFDRIKQPITINYQVVLSFEMRPAPRDPGKQALFVNMDPIVTIWNPLDVAVDLAPHQNPQGANKCLMIVYWVIPYDINVQVNGGGLRRCSLMRSVYNRDFASTATGIDYNMLRLNVGEAERLTLKPGEVIKISQTGNTDAGNGGFVGLNGRKGFNYGGGSRFALLDENGQYILLDGAEQISYSAAPNNLTAGRDNASGGNIIAGFSQQNSRRWSLTHNSVVMGSPWGTNVHMGMVGIDHCFGFNRAKLGETRTASNKTLANSQRVLANDPKYAEVFPTIAGAQNTRMIPAASIASRKAPFMLHSYSVKTEMENKRGTRMLARFNPKAHNIDFFNLSDEERDMMPYEVGVTPLTSWLNAPLDESTTGQGFFGSSLASEFGSNFVTTHSVPRQPIVSLAAFQNSFANGFNRLHEASAVEHSMARLPMLPQISHAIGNSLAPPLIAPNQTEGNLPNNPRPLADHSFLANRALWDDWFLSGIAPQRTPAFARNRDQRTVALDFFNVSTNTPLPVARYRAALDGQNPTTLLGTFFSGARPNDRAITQIASYLRVDGLFNVNSTSVEAWKLMLGSLKGRQVVVRDQNGVETLAPATANTPVSGIAGPANIVLTDQGAPRANSQWAGRRELTDEEIDQLARAIVREVRKRGPFLSLADFVNRRVGTDRNLAKSGAIQSALDANDVTINRNQNTGRAVSNAVSSRFVFPEAERGAMNYGAPSVVKQGDILTPIAPVLSARSDSFIIRSYGESVDGNGIVLARAWCEAVVERDRNFVDAGDAATVAVASLSRSLNRVFGRKFKLISFRWIHPQEI